jgi:hypothetical protein
MSTVSQRDGRSGARNLLVIGTVIGVGGGGAMILWIFANAMGHSGFYWWPLWYSGCAGLVVASLLFVGSARLALRGARRRIAYEAVAYFLALVCGIMGIWGIATAMAM